jgi:hypothetical protein
MKMIATLLLALASLSAKDIEIQKEPVVQNVNYVSLGLGPMPILLPVFGIGHRIQNGHHGADLSLQATTVVALTQLKASLLYQYYFKPSLASEFYVGGGVSPGVVFGSGEHAILLSPEFVFGKQYRNESHDLRFFQAQVSFPTWAFDDTYSCYYHRKSSVGCLKLPLVVLTYGLGF